MAIHKLLILEIVIVFVIKGLVDGKILLPFLFLTALIPHHKIFWLLFDIQMLHISL